jgi:paraquat-inducible protein B
MKRNALLVGAFVIAALLITVTAVLWLSGNNLFQQQTRAFVFFEGSVSGLYVGAPVTFRGVAVGQVDDIGIEVDSQTLQARLPVRVRLRPDAVRMSDRAEKGPPELSTLVERGLRARLVAQSFVTGQKSIELDFLPDAPAVFVSDNRAEEIPTQGDRFGALIDQVAELPLRDTVQDLRTTLQALQRTLDSTQTTLDVTARELSSTASQARETLVVATEAIRQVQGNANRTLSSVTQLAGSMTQLSDTTRETVVGLQPEVQRTLAGAREAAETARLAMSRVAELTAPGAPLRGDLDAAVRDLSQAARGLRDWSELLEEQPNAVIFGAERR